MDTLDFIVKKYGLKIPRRSPVEIPNVGREQLAGLFAELGFMRGAEIGVFEGKYSEILCKANPALNLLCVDSWITYENFFIPHMEGAEAKARARLAPYPGVTFMHMDSEAAANDVPDGSLDFVYIDGNHDFVHCAQDIAFWERKVRPGGIVAGHDYYILRGKQRENNPLAVVWVLHGWTAAHNIHPWFIFGTKAIVPGEIRERRRSWMWVKR